MKSKSFKERIRDKFTDIVEPHKLYRMFKQLPNTIEVRVMKNDRRIQIALRDSESNTLRFLREKDLISKTDVIVDYRDNKYLVVDVLIDQPFELKDEDGLIKTVNTILVKYTPNFKDEMSLLEQATQIANVTSNINVTIENIQNSSIQDFGKTIAQISQTQDFKTTWSKLEHDLDFRFEYQKYEALRKNINNVIEKNDVTILKKNNWEKVAKSIGGFLGALLANFLIVLVEHLNK